MSSMPGLVIAVHSFFANLVHWKTLAVPAQDWVLITKRESAKQLSSEQLGRCQVLVTETFSVESLGKLIQEARAGSRRDFCVVTMQEHLQMTVAALRERFAVAGPSAAQMEKFVDKRSMKQPLACLGDFLPRWRAFDSAAYAANKDAWMEETLAQVGLPAFAKPTRSVSSAGAAKIHSKQELRQYLDAAVPETEIDEYIECAAAYHLDSVVQDGKVLWFGASQYLYPSYDTLKGAPYIDLLLERETPKFFELQALNEQVIQVMDSVPDGCTHLEVLQQNDGKYRFLEIAARPPGLRIPEMYGIHQGIDLRMIHYQLQAGQTPSLSPRPGPLAASYHSYKIHQGKVRRTFVPGLASEHRSELFPTWLEREEAVTSTGLGDVLTSEVFWSHDRALLERDIELLKTFIPYELA